MDVAFLILLTHKNFLINIDIIPTDIEELLILGENSNWMSAYGHFDVNKTMIVFPIIMCSLPSRRSLP